jgi:hypothetical protein
MKGKSSFYTNTPYIGFLTLLCHGLVPFSICTQIVTFPVLLNKLFCFVVIVVSSESSLERQNKIVTKGESKKTLQRFCLSDSLE